MAPHPWSAKEKRLAKCPLGQGTGANANALRRFAFSDVPWMAGLRMRIGQEMIE